MSTTSNAPAKRGRPPLSKKAKVELAGKSVSILCIAVVVLLVVTLVFMVAQHGLATFFVDGISPIAFLTGTDWNPHVNDEAVNPLLGALPMIVGSFSVTLLSTVISIPFAIGSAIFVVEIAPRFGRKVFQPVVELLVGIPSVVYGLLGLTIVVGFMRDMTGTTGYGILSASIVLALMILPTITSLSIDAITAVPKSYREGSYGVGASRWQTIWHVVLKSALPSLMTAVILGMTRAFGETLAVRMVIGGAEVMPASLLSPASTITTTLTTSMAIYADGSVQKDVLWSLGLMLMGMSLIFIMIIHFIGKKGAKSHG